MCTGLDVMKGTSYKTLLDLTLYKYQHRVYNRHTCASSSPRIEPRALKRTKPKIRSPVPMCSVMVTQSACACHNRVEI